VTFVAAWPEAGVPAERSSELDGAAIHAAGLRAPRLWPDEEFLDDGPATSVGTVVVGSAGAPPPAQDPDRPPPAQDPQPSPGDGPTP
jgi:hypothetical protein